MKKTFKAIFICCLLAITLTLTLASCGGDNETTNTENTEVIKNTEVTENTENTENTESSKPCDVSGHAYDNACDTDCNVCGETRTTEHTGGTATCGAKAVCESCGTAYGELDLDNHVVIDGSCACGEIWHIDATEMTAEQLNAAVAEKLAAGETDVEIILAPDAPAEMFTAIRRALIDTEGVADGSVNLTLAGVTAIPDHSEFAIVGPAIFGEVIEDENGEPFDEGVTQLASVDLPDVLTIGEGAFLGCKNLTAVTAPKVQTIGRKAFCGTGLTSVDLPEATTIEYIVFYCCFDITELHLPKVTVLGDQALDFFQPKNEVTIYLTSADEIAVNKDCFYGLEYYGNLDTKVNLVLNINKQSEVNGNTWTTKDANGNEVSFTFKSITFI